MLLSFTTLAITGLVQKFALSPVSDFIVAAVGRDRERPRAPIMSPPRC